MKNYIITGLATLCVLGTYAQTLNLERGGIIIRYPAEKTGIMNFNQSKTLDIAGQTFEIEDISHIFITEGTIENNLVEIIYKGEKAEVYVSYDLLPYVSAQVNGAKVEITQSDDVGEDTSGEITYRLSGNSTDGSFTLNGSYKSGIELVGLDLVSTSGAAIDIQNGKRIALKVKEGTTNYIEDSEGGTQKAALYCKGHLEFKQKGTLTVKGNTGHAISSKEYVEIKNSTINITGAVKDGINCAQYFLMESGNLSIKGTGDDGIQTDYKDNDNRDDEDTGTVTITGGFIDIAVTADATKAIKAEGDIFMSGGNLIASTSGNGIWDETKTKTKASSCLGANENIIIDGGILNLTSTGGGGKGINADGSLEVGGGEITILTSGGIVAYVNNQLNQDYTGNTDRLGSDYKSSPKGIKIDGDINISDGLFKVTCTGRGGEGIESKSNLTISGGIITIRAYDDGTNSSETTAIEGGDLDIMSIGNGDGVDSNGDIYISGGHMMIFGVRQPEQGFDAGDGYSIYITGGEIMAVGGGNSVPSKSYDNAQAYIALSQSVAAGDVVSVSTTNGEVLISFTVPSDYDPTNAGMFDQPGNMPRYVMGPPPFKAPGRPGGMGPGGMGAGLVISCPEFVNGNQYDVLIGNNSYSATAKIVN